MSGTSSDEGGIYGLEPEAPAPRRSAVRPPAPDAKGPAVKCRKCGYDIRGLASGRCPECGTPLRAGTLGSTGGEERPSLKDKPALYAGVLATGGFVAAVALSSLTTEGGTFAERAAAFAVGYGAAMLLACVVYFACAMLWIGWSSFFWATMLQVAAAYSITFAASVVLGFIPIPIIGWALSVFILVGLLVELVDLEIPDAIIVAMLVIFARAVIVAAIVTAMLAQG